MSSSSSQFPPDALTTPFLGVEIPNPSTPLARQPLPPPQYSSRFFPVASQPSDNQIPGTEGKLLTLLQDIAKNINKIPDSSVKNLLKTTFARDINTIHQLKNLVKELECKCLCTTECCCVLSFIMVVSTGIGALFAYVGGLFGIGACSSANAVMGLEYGAMVGAAAGGALSLLAYLKNFYELVKIAHKINRVEDLQAKLEVLRLRLDLHNDPNEDRREDTPNSGFHEISL